MNHAIAKKRSFKGRLSSLPYNWHVAPYIFLIPFILSFLIFNVYPIFSSFVMSLQKIRGFGSATWVGLDNYQKLLNNAFYASLKTTTLVTVCNCMMFADTETGAINSIFISLGLPQQRFMLQYGWSIFLMVFLTAWKSAGMYMIYFLSGLQAIPSEVYESAEIDGATGFQRLTRITLPLLKPTMIYVLTMLIVEGYRTFGESYVFWKESTPGNLGLTIVRYLYQQAFTSGNLGFGSAIGFALLFIVLIINLVQMKLMGLFDKE